MGYDIRHHKFSGAWCQLLRHHLEKHRKTGKLTRIGFVHQLGMTEQMVSAYLAGRNRPPLDKIERMADILMLEGEDRDSFVFQSHEHYTPYAVWQRVTALSASLDDAIKQRAQHTADLAHLRTRNADLQSQLDDANTELASIRTEIVQLRALAVKVAQQFTGLPR